MVRDSRAVPALLLTALLSLAACSDEPESPAATAEGTAEGTAAGTAGGTTGHGAGSAYLPVPDSVSLTPPGTALEHGQSATVAWRLGGDAVGVVDLEVEKVREVTMAAFEGWLGGPAAEQSRPYWVTVTVQNRGGSELGGEPVPLLLLDDRGTLAPPSTFGGRRDFRPCPSGSLPDSFGPGEEAELCLVYLAPLRATIDAMSFHPVADFDAITWQGEVVEPKDGQDKQGKQGRRGKRDEKSGKRGNR